MKKGIKYGLIMISILSAFYLFEVLIFLRTEVVCAKVKQEGETKGRKGMVYFYKYQGKIYKGSFDSSTGFCMRIDCYDKDECVDVEVSTTFPSMSRLKKKN